MNAKRLGLRDGEYLEQFLPASSYAGAVLGVVILSVRLSVCLSVCLSVTRVLCDKTK